MKVKMYLKYILLQFYYLISMILFYDIIFNIIYNSNKCRHALSIIYFLTHPN